MATDVTDDWRVSYLSGLMAPVSWHDLAIVSMDGECAHLVASVLGATPEEVRTRAHLMAASKRMRDALEGCKHIIGEIVSHGGLSGSGMFDLKTAETRAANALAAAEPPP